jgi:cytochrome c
LRKRDVRFGSIWDQAKIIDPSTVLDAHTLPKISMPNRDGFIPDPRPEQFK